MFIFSTSYAVYLFIFYVVYRTTLQQPDEETRTYNQVSNFIQLNAQLGYSRLKLTLKFTLKCSYMFQLTNHHQGALFRALLKL